MTIVECNGYLRVDVVENEGLTLDKNKNAYRLVDVENETRVYLRPTAQILKVGEYHMIHQNDIVLKEIVENND